MATPAEAKTGGGTPSQTYDHLFKVLVVGDAGVGKSAILLRFTSDTYTDDELPTIGVDLRVKFLDVDVPGAEGVKKRVKLTIWDTAGQERFRTLTASYYRGSHGTVLVYDVTRRETFDSLQHWCEEIEHHSGGSGGVVKVLVGNKIDAADARQVSRREGEAFARERGMLFIETSAKTKVGIHQVFVELCHQILERPDLLAPPGGGGTGPAPGGSGAANLARPGAGEDEEQGGCC